MHTKRFNTNFYKMGANPYGYNSTSTDNVDGINCPCTILRRNFSRIIKGENKH